MAMPEPMAADGAFFVNLGLCHQTMQTPLSAAMGNGRRLTHNAVIRFCRLSCTGKGVQV